MKHLIPIAIFVVLFFLVYSIVVSAYNSMWREGVIWGSTLEEAEFYAGLFAILHDAIGILLVIPLALIIDRLGRLQTLASLGLALGVVNILIGAVNDYISLLILHGLQGLFQLAMTLVIMVIIADTLVEFNRALGYATYYASAVLGYPLGIVVGTTIYWRIGYALFGSLIAMASVAAFASIFLPIKGSSLLRVLTERTRYSISLGIKDISSKTALAIWIIIFFWGIPWGAVSAYAITYFRDVWRFSETIATILALIGSLSMVVGHFVGGWLSDRGVKMGDPMSRVKIPTYGLVIGLISMLATVAYPAFISDINSETSPHLYVAFILSAIGMLFTTIPYSSYAAILSEIVSTKFRALAFGIYMMASGLGWALGPFLYSHLKDIISPLYAMTLIVSTWIIPLAILRKIVSKHYLSDRLPGGGSMEQS
jgi:MFS family permease